jgi:hypothetical protein
MVSIAMVVLLLVGIHQVFRMSSNTIGTGQAVVAVNREVRSAQTVMQEDFRRSMKDSPLFIIHSAPVAANVVPQDPTSSGAFSPSIGGSFAGFQVPLFHFNTIAERDRDLDGDPATIDRDGDGSEETTYTARNIAQVNDRIHRSDIFGFFARGLFTRQTADDGRFNSDTTAFDAWVWYGHTKLPDDATGAYLDPGVGPANAESRNKYAGNWVLGRRAILLKPPGATNEAALGAAFVNGLPVPLGYRSPINQAAKSSATFEARSATAGAGGAQANKKPLLFQSRIDLAATTLEQCRADLRALLMAFPNDWFNPLIFRYECDPRVRKPINSGNLAKTTPYLVGNVSQFLVEFAGDFITQNNDINDPDYGLVTDSVPDGVIDFVMLAPNVFDQTNPPAYPANPRVRKTRWYGLPRDSNGDGNITGVVTNGELANAMPDVVPVWDVVRSGLPNAAAPPFEMWNPNQGMKYKGVNGYGSVGAPNDFRYVCAWTDNAPAMLRIVMKLEDPAGRLADGHWVEFVLDAP